MTSGDYGGPRRAVEVCCLREMFGGGGVLDNPTSEVHRIQPLACPIWTWRFDFTHPPPAVSHASILPPETDPILGTFWPLSE